MASWDVIVIGLGGVGKHTMYHLASSGHRVLGIDQYPPVHDFGSSHGHTRIIRQAYFEHPAYVPLLRRAYDLWDEAEQCANVKLLYRTGLVEIGPSDGVVLSGILRSARQHDLDVEQISIDDVIRRWPGIRGEPRWQAMVENNAGFLRVEDCVRAHLDLARQAGASCVHGVQVRSWESTGSGIQVETDEGVERADRLVIAAGSWTTSLLRQRNARLRVLRKHQYWFDTDSVGYELEAGFPCFFHETPAGMFYGFPSMDGAGVKVSRHSGGIEVAQPDLQLCDDADDQSLVEDFVASYLPGVSNRIKRQSQCYYTTTPDEHFIVDTLEDHPQVTLVAGLSGHGFKFTSVLGEIASQLATGQRPTLEIDLFVLNRIL